MREVVARRRAVILPILSSETRFWLVGAAAGGSELLPVESGDGGYGVLAPLTERTYNVSKVRFSAALGEEPEVELVLV